MIFSYRTRQLLKRVFAVLLHMILVAVSLVFCWLLWLQRFVLYTPEGVQLDFAMVQSTAPAVIPSRPEQAHVSIEYVGEAAVDEEEEVVVVQPKRLEGYYVDVYTLMEDASVLLPQLEALPAGTPVLVDIKNYWGYFYYTSALGSVAKQSNAQQVDALFAYLAESDLYTIARFPSLRDYDFGLNQYTCGIMKTNGYLWEDEKKCYWLDPAKDGTLSHLIQIIKELRGMGFDEVVLQDFQIPQADSIVYPEPSAALETAAQALVTACATEQFTVSFVASQQFDSIPDSRSRLYLTDVAAADVAQLVEKLGIADPESRVVIIAQTYDTRYDVCGTLHPLDQAH